MAQPSTSQHLVKARLAAAYSSGASIYPNKQWRAGMRENAERERAVEDDPHGFWHRFGRTTRWHSKDGICRAFRPVGVELEHGVLNDSAHHSIRFGYVPEIGSWRKYFLDSQRAKHAPKVAIVGAPLATPGARTTAAKKRDWANTGQGIYTRLATATAPKAQVSETIARKRGPYSKGPTSGSGRILRNVYFHVQISPKHWHLQKVEVHTLPKNLER